jgi:hypothetical protein
VVTARALQELHVTGSRLHDPEVRTENDPGTEAEDGEEDGNGGAGHGRTSFRVSTKFRSEYSLKYLFAAKS